MKDPARIELARPPDAPAIARMSRDLIEYALPWTWQASRVLRHVCRADSTVITARGAGELAGFAIMRFGAEEAHLDLLAVARSCQRRGVGREMLRWLECSAQVAGISVIHLEVRETNQGGCAFYRRLGYRQVGRAPGYYCGREAALRFARDLWEGRAAESPPAPHSSRWGRAHCRTRPGNLLIVNSPPSAPAAR